MLFAVFVGAELLVAEGRTPDAISLALEVNDHPLFGHPRSVEAFLRKLMLSGAVHIEDARNDVVGVPVDDHEVERWWSYGRQDRLAERAMRLAFRLRSMFGG